MEQQYFQKKNSFLFKVCMCSNKKVINLILRVGVEVIFQVIEWLLTLIMLNNVYTVPFIEITIQKYHSFNSIQEIFNLIFKAMRNCNV